MEELFCDILFDIEYKAYIDKDYSRIYLYANNECVDSFSRFPDIKRYMVSKHSNLLSYHEFDLEKAEYVWSINKFLKRNKPVDFEIKYTMVKCFVDVTYMYFCLNGYYNKIGGYNFSENNTKLYMLLEQKKLLDLKYKTCVGSRWTSFDEVLIWNIEYKLNKMCKKIENMGGSFLNFTYDGLTISKEVV